MPFGGRAGFASAAVQIPRRGEIRNAESPEYETMTTAEIQVGSETELERVEHWRAEELIRAGYAPTDAVALAARHDIDLHSAVGLMTLGCPYELAIEILI
jgi:hypothetical protein